MYLKQLTVRGFKSFASATTFRFEPGVTAVVGPNGSGKSNVVDALAWVMGEQGAKNLRGGKMDDVIFAGTSSRAPLGRAQVTLTIDNSDGLLPIEYSEVTISRTLFRSGGSEYSINDRPSRLLDIQELLSDSGLGREMHVIVGQGQLDRVLHATAEDRRGLIEEAAGVLKHRRRREKAYRKLQSTDANLARLADLTGEVARSLKPLERQARVARRARDIQADLKDAEARLAADSLASASADEASTAAQRDEAQADVDRLAADIEAFEAQAPGVAQEFSEAQRRLEAARSRLGAARRAVERLGVVAELAASRGEALSDAQNTGEAEREAKRIAEQLAEAEQDEQDAAAEAERLRGEAASAQTASQAAERALREADAVVAQLQREQAAAREELLRVRGAAEAVTGRVQSARSELERAQALADDAAAAENAAHRALADLETEDDEGADAPQDPAAAQRTVTAAQAARVKAEKALAEARSSARGAESAAAGLDARASTLASTLEAMQPDGQSAAPEGARPFAEGLVVDPAWTQAVGALLGAAASLPVAPRGDSDAAIVFEDAFPRADASTTPESGNGGSVRAALDVARHERHLSVLETLLAGTAVAADRAEALEALEAESGLRAVALEDGLVVTRAGQWRPLEGQGNAVDLAAQLAEVERKRDAAAEESERLASEVERAEAEVAARREEEQTARAAASEAQTRHAVRSAAKDSAKKNAAQARSRSEQLHAAAEQSAARLSELLASQEEAERRVELLEEVRAGESEEDGLEPARRAAHEARDAAGDAQRAATDAALAARSAEERHRALRHRAGELRSGLERSEKAARAQAAAERRRRILRARAERVEALASGAVAAAEAEREEARGEHGEAEERFREAQRAHEDHQRRGRARREEHGQRAAALATAEAHLVHQSARREELERAALEQHGLSPEELLRSYGPDVLLEDGTAFDRAEQSSRLRQAQKDMQALGKVNPLALEEFAALEQRHSYLAGQLADLRGSRADLLKIIQDVDETIERVFASAFEDTAREFVDVFGRLFPGGEGSLVLTEPDDLLSSGLEVNARPAGKKVKRLSLLSGGERSLTAIALLVAIFKARPSPFYVMDEVEAALDDANLGRLIGLFRELRDSSQLIIVTHQKRTMEVADALYGVSMRGDGVSLVVSQRMAREDQPEGGETGRG
ncbi:chromosome segregation protein SMC [Arthrobacter sp. UM1]|uniref:chromosome segregation protein SMC n=1 Tax=Arthrobacter sp. UM1 TaxID=2766776 RepID=UPI001CF6990A|nr:chromosome segregation protein SMC [Arthrobacter sp. UM1]MCB4207314.1 chromosome segregation protein SMC [Arthrobacter sp. UM1]